jgi:hypothetical protein
MSLEHCKSIFACIDEQIFQAKLPYIAHETAI